MKFYQGNIYHVKIAQRSIRREGSTVDYFPYDNVYIVHRNDEPRIKRMFRYYLVMDYTEIIAKMLNSLRIEKERTVKTCRDDTALEGYTFNKTNRFSITRPEDWLLVVPTHVRSKIRKGHKIPDVSEVGYIMSSVICINHNLGINLPAIAIQTPDTKIPLLCSICANLPSYYDGKCLPGTHDCRRNAKTRLPLDNDKKHALELSAEEVAVT